MNSRAVAAVETHHSVADKVLSNYSGMRDKPTKNVVDWRWPFLLTSRPTCHSQSAHKKLMCYSFYPFQRCEGRPKKLKVISGYKGHSKSLVLPPFHTEYTNLPKFLFSSCSPISLRRNYVRILVSLSSSTKRIGPILWPQRWGAVFTASHPAGKVRSSSTWQVIYRLENHILCHTCTFGAPLEFHKDL